MKKTALKRNTRLNPMSAKKKAMQPAYKRALDEAIQTQMEVVGYTYCERCGRHCEPVPHHTNGRIGRALLSFVMVCQIPCHDFIHSNSRAARAEGWLK